MIDYKKLQDANSNEYINRTISEINQASVHELEDNLRMLQIKLYNRDIDTINATIIMNSIKTRLKELKYRQINNKTYRTTDNESGGRSISLNPTGSNGHTSVSNRAGAAAVVFIVVNVAITTAMYTLLLLSKLFK